MEQAKPLHYIDTHDAPPRRCALSLSTDCPSEGCLYSALVNVTHQLASRAKTSSLTPEIVATTKEALQFFIHFMGDLHQPLHTCGRDRGGTRAPTKFFGKMASMHFVWDNLILEKRIVENFNGKWKEYATYLENWIRSTPGPTVTWPSCHTSSLPLNSDMQAQTVLLSPASSDTLETVFCPSEWAETANQLNCNLIWVGYKRRRELGPSYFNSTWPVLETLIAQVSSYKIKIDCFSKNL